LGNLHKIARLGDVVAAAFDEAERYSRDPREVSRLATHAITHLLRRPRATPPIARARFGGRPGARGRLST